MVEISRFFNATEQDDRVYEADDLGKFFMNFLGNGFFLGLAVEPDGGNMSVALEEGSAFIEGYEYANTDDLILTHDSADAQYDRIDRIVLRLDRQQETRFIRARIKKGTAESGAEPPDLTRDDYIWELSLAQVKVEGGKSFIESSQITDERGDRDLCGRVEKPAKINDQVDDVDIKSPDTRAYQYHHETSTFRISGDVNESLMQAWLDDIGVSPSDYGRDLDQLRMHVETVGSRNDTGKQVVTIYDWSQQQNYKIYGRFHRASNSALSANTDWGSWHEEPLEQERTTTSGGSYCIRYTNGQQVCYSSGVSLTGVSNSTGALYRTLAQEWVVPAPFISDDENNVHVTYTTSGNDRWAATTGGIGDGETIPFRVFSTLSSPTKNTNVHIKAEGRWR